MKLTAEAKVGIFVFLGIILLVYMSMWLGGVRLGMGEGMRISVSFPSAGGLDKDAAVTVAGVEVGRVSEILLEDNKAKLILEIVPGVTVGSDFTAVMKSKGMLGERYVELVPGDPSAPPLADGGEIKHTGTYTDMDKLISTLTDVAEDVKGITAALNVVVGGEEGGERLKNIVMNVEDISESLNRIISRNDQKFNNIIDNLDNLMVTLRADSPTVLKGLKEVTQSLNEVIAENRGNLKDSMENLRRATIQLERAMESISKISEEVGPQVGEAVESIGSVARKIDEGKGTLGKLVNETETHEHLTKTLSGLNKFFLAAERFRTYIGYRGEVLFEEGDVKNYFTLRIQPRDDKYYLFEIVDSPSGNRRTKITKTTVGGVTTTRKVVTTDDDLLFSAQIAKRFDDLVLRGGLIESTGGFGLEYFLMDDRLRLTFEAFDFDKDRNPHLKAGAMFLIHKFFYLTAGYDDFISSDGFQSAYLGVGFQFEDEDLKYLLGSVPPISF